MAKRRKMAARTPAQQAFDLAKHGWAFCSVSMLAARLPKLRELAAQLDPDDARQDTLRMIEHAVSEGDRT